MLVHSIGSSHHAAAFLGRLGPSRAREFLEVQARQMSRAGDLLRQGVPFAKVADLVCGAKPSRPTLKERQAQLNARKRELAHHDSTWGTASHEAGHAIAAVKYGFRGLSIARNIRTAAEAGSVTIRNLSSENPLDVLTMVYCGPVAECWSRNQSAEYAALRSDGDLAIACMALEQVTGKPEQIKQVKLAHSRACDLLREHDKALDCIARELVVRGWLDADELRRIVRSN